MNKLLSWFFAAALLLPLWLFAAPARHSLKAPRLLSDSSGGIHRLLLHFADYDIIPTLYGVLRHLPVDTELVIATPRGVRQQLLQTLLRDWPLTNRQRVTTVALDEPMTFWIRDEFVAANAATIILPKRYGTDGVPESIEKLDKSVHLKRVHSLLEFDGGNVVVSDEQVFVGYNLIQENLGPLFSTEKEIVEYLRQLFGREIVVVGSAAVPVPHEHIDMYLTPLGHHRLLLGDPRLATTLLEKHRQLLNSTYGKNYFNAKTTPLPESARKILFNTADFVSRLNQDLGVSRSGSGLTAAVAKDDDVTLALLYARNNLPSNLALFDNLAADLRKKGFKEIIRVPILMNHDIENGPFITYNNLLMHMTDREKTVFLPNYNIPPLDDNAQKTIESLGYKAIPIDVQNISFYNGTLRCITQVLARH